MRQSRADAVCDITTVQVESVRDVLEGLQGYIVACTDSLFATECWQSLNARIQIETSPHPAAPPPPSPSILPRLTRPVRHETRQDSGMRRDLSYVSASHLQTFAYPLVASFKTTMFTTQD